MVFQHSILSLKLLCIFQCETTDFWKEAAEPRCVVRPLEDTAGQGQAPWTEQGKEAFFVTVSTASDKQTVYCNSVTLCRYQACESNKILDVKQTVKKT